MALERIIEAYFLKVIGRLLYCWRRVLIILKDVVAAIFGKRHLLFSEKFIFSLRSGPRVETSSSRQGPTA
ncbi:hypothetical protein FC82_GL000695 [Secundilactobacillus collinoides DSM 20515 = JCM 1123]|uniref:Uncharacterized protein n=1 Tax=Secundilactobacillus collinoides DSM 20515 = JCM 1123 TaxID=1423733 RepID=A0A0R2BF72_SECCO|nr:hypothetical protein FC82_GL000695 [Secundilactobacillus collinoides DSM 20515 = JCM 1123]